MSDGDPFQILGLQPAFELDAAVIERAYLIRIAPLHPDTNEHDQQASADLNRARQRLLDPESRAAALLERLGPASPEAAKALPEGFLHEMLQTRLEIEQAVEQGDGAALAYWRRWAQDRRRESISAVSRLFREAAPPLEIRRALNAWRYIQRLAEQLPEASG
jgi:curved DNA-binding protein CbpA